MTRATVGTDTLRDEFVIAGLRHVKLASRPNAELRGLKKIQIGHIAFDVFADFRTEIMYARAYIGATGEVAWYAVTKEVTSPNGDGT